MLKTCLTAAIAAAAIALCPTAHADPTDDAISQYAVVPELGDYLYTLRSIGFIQSPDDVNGAVFLAAAYCYPDEILPAIGWGTLASHGLTVDQFRQNFAEYFVDAAPDVAAQVVGGLGPVCSAL